MIASTTDTVPLLVTWDYLLLKAINIAPGVVRPQARLLCEDDDGGWTTVIRCDDSYLDYLKPYAELLEAAEAGLDTEYPVVPVVLSNGRADFSIQGAQYDYPHLLDQRMSRLQAVRASLAIPTSPPPQFSEFG